MKYLLTLITLIMLLPAFKLKAQLLVYESFSYSLPAYIGGNGDNGSFSNNWTTQNVLTGQTTTIDIENGSLMYPGIKSPTGNKVKIFGNGNATSRDVNRGFTTSSKIVYYSALIKIVDNTQLATTFDNFMAFSSTSGSVASSYGGRIGIKAVNEGSNFKFGVSNTSTGAPAYTEYSLDLDFGTTYFIVIKYDISVIPNIATLWINPIINGSEPSGFITNNIGTTTWSAIASINLRNNATTPKAEIDEIRVGLDWNSVAPTGVNFTANQTRVSNCSYINFNEESITNYTSWEWTFPGGNPATSNVKNPSGINYNTEGDYDVKLIASNGERSDTAFYENYINVAPLEAISKDAIIVCGGAAQLDVSDNYSGSGSLTYTWEPPTDLSSQTIKNPIANPTKTTVYEVTINTDNKCITKSTITVNVDPLTVDAGGDKSFICGGSTKFDYPKTNYTGTGLLTFSWLPSDGLDNVMLPQPMVETTHDNTYTVTVSTTNGCIAKDTVIVNVDPFLVTVDDLNVMCGNTAQLNVNTNYTGSGILSYDWKPAIGLTASDISNPLATLVSPTGYSVEVLTPNGCKANDNVNIGVYALGFNPSICMVTVNDNDKNVIVWQREQDNAIESYYIYRESSFQTGQYDLIGTVPYTETGVFIDDNSNARVQSNKYKIADKDICGFVTEKSVEHKTMHLTINKGTGINWNLIWEQYSGLPVSSYNIYRGTAKESLTLIGTTSGSNTTYTDETAPTGNVYYQIEVIVPAACTNLKSSGYGSSRSNITTNAGVVGLNTMPVKDAFIYPNPASDKLFIKNGPSKNAILMIFDLQGKQVLNLMNVTEQIDISKLSKGIYTVRLINSGRVMVNKLVKE